MSDRMTSINISNCTGLADYGKKTRAEMIAQYRSYAAHNKAEAEKVLAATDDDFIVEQYTGRHVKRNRVRLEPEKRDACDHGIAYRYACDECDREVG